MNVEVDVFLLRCSGRSKCRQLTKKKSAITRRHWHDSAVDTRRFSCMPISFCKSHQIGDCSRMNQRLFFPNPHNVKQHMVVLKSQHFLTTQPRCELIKCRHVYAFGTQICGNFICCCRVSADANRPLQFIVLNHFQMALINFVLHFLVSV